MPDQPTYGSRSSSLVRWVLEGSGNSTRYLLKIIDFWSDKAPGDTGNADDGGRGGRGCSGGSWHGGD